MSIKDIRAAVKACEAAGLQCDRAHKHPRIVDPKTLKYVTFSNTPSCAHAYKNLLRDVRKYLGRRIEL